MRSSKSRSRNKNNRNRSVGNIVNRVFDSSGPEGKVRGTPQQIIDKYLQLYRDAQLSNDRVAAENFQQHAEHYTRMLSEAQREQEARREQQERENAERQRERDQQRAERQERGASNQPQGQTPVQDPGAGDHPDLAAPMATVDAGADGPVETPESSEKPARKPRSRNRKPKAASEDAPQPEVETPAASASDDGKEAAE